jgi:hypothetical protein
VGTPKTPYKTTCGKEFSRCAVHGTMNSPLCTPAVPILVSHNSTMQDVSEPPDLPSTSTGSGVLN